MLMPTRKASSLPRATGGDRPLAVITVTDVTQLAATEARLTAVLD